MINDNTAQWRLKKITNVTNNFDGYWQAGEAVEVGTLRFPRGQENTGYILECVGAGTTGTVQPEFTTTTNEIANYSDLGVVGRMRMIFNLAEKDVDEILAMGITYSRLTYPELWDWAGKRAGLVISEEEWQAKFAETNGKFVPYYSSGDGSSTFRTPLLGAYLKGAESSSDVGKYVDAGLPNITGDFLHYMNGAYSFGAESISTGAFTKTQIANRQAITNSSGVYSTCAMGIDASLCSEVYGNSDTVTPDTMVGIWVIKAVGVVVDSGETDIAQLLTANEQTQERVSVVEDWTKDSANFSSMPSSSDIVISLTKNYDTYTAPADGWLILRGEPTVSSRLVRIVVGSKGVAFNHTQGQSYPELMFPIAKGQTATFVVGSNYADIEVKFYYARSEV